MSHISAIQRFGSAISHATSLFLLSAAVFIFLPDSASSQTVTNQLGNWRFDEGSGATAADSSGSSNNGTLINGPAWIPGKSATALDFDGIDDSVRFNSVDQAQVSISAWVYSDSKGDSDFPRIVETPAWRLFFGRSVNATSNNNIGFATKNATTGGEWRTSAGSIQDGRWYHVVVSFDSSLAANDPAIYLDGVPQTVTRTTEPSGALNSNAGTGNIGNSPAADRSWDGKIDEVYLFSKVVSTSEVQSLFGGSTNDGLPGSPRSFRIQDGGAGSNISTSITSPSSGATITGTAAVSASASSSAALTKVELWVDGVLKGTDVSSPFSFSLDTTSLSNGPHSLMTKAYDQGGSIASSASVAVTVNNGTPSNKLYPADHLDLSYWKVTLPIGSSGSPTEILQPALDTYKHDTFFTLTPGKDAVLFRAPVNGVTTSGSSNPRSELREMETNGTTRAAWGPGKGVPRTMEIEQMVTHLPLKKSEIVLGQVHDGADDVTVFRVNDTDTSDPNSRVELWVTDGDNTRGTLVDSDFQLNRRIKTKIVYTADGKLQMWYDKLDGSGYVMKREFTGKCGNQDCYFKAGAYTQANCSSEASGTCTADNYGEVVIYNLSITGNGSSATTTVPVTTTVPGTTTVPVTTIASTTTRPATTTIPVTTTIPGTTTTSVAGTTTTVPGGGGGTLRIAMAGDWDEGAGTEANIRNARDNADVLLMLGDLSYGVAATTWCNMLKANIGNVPVLVLPGDHDSGTDTGQLMTDLLPCLPPKPAAPLAEFEPGANYPYKYWVDLKGHTRVIVTGGIRLSTNITAGKEATQNWNLGQSNYTWLKNSITSARTKGIKHILVANHEPCLDISSKKYNRGGYAAVCEDVLNLLVAEKVDIMTSGSSHTYWRSKGLVHNATCSRVEVEAASPASCIVDVPNQKNYTKGAGMVQLQVGTGGTGGYGCVASGDPELALFYTGTCSAADGITILNIDGTSISGVQKLSTGAIHDSYTIAP